mgnify:CR=1 FL=1
MQKGAEAGQGSGGGNAGVGPDLDVIVRRPVRQVERREGFIAGVEAARAAGGDESPLAVLLKVTFRSKHVLEKAVRSWAANDARARAAVAAVDRRRLDYIEGLLTEAGLAGEVARARAQILFWAFFGYALSDQQLAQDKQQAVLDELLRIVTR